MSIDVLQAKIHKLKSPVMVGLDPSPALIPPSLIEGEGVAAMADAYERFCEGILEAVHGVAPAVKLQERCFLALGAEGVAVMQRLMEKAAKMGFYVLLDSNYASVEHISQLYADALFGENAPYTCDGVTVNGYLGGDNVKPFLPYCRDARKNLFCYVRTSNKSSREVQELISGDRLVYTAVTDLIMRWSTDLFAKNGYSEITAPRAAMPAASSTPSTGWAAAPSSAPRAASWAHGRPPATKRITPTAPGRPASRCATTF